MSKMSHWTVTLLSNLNLNICVCSNLCLCSFRVRHKQNKYPILFLTQGISDRYPEIMDIRCQTTQIAISFAQSENILVSTNIHYAVFNTFY